MSTDREDHHYSGINSMKFWDRVNALKGEDHAALYAFSCVLQSLEESLLHQLRNAEAKAANASWEDVHDKWADEIDEAHPTRSGSYDEYGVAMQMVGHRHSKGALVSLVNWLLVRLKEK
jgi:hypothetical protein